MATLAFELFIPTEVGVEDMLVLLKDFFSYFLTSFYVILLIWTGVEG